jgi:hypothetical protein
MMHAQPILAGHLTRRRCSPVMPSIVLDAMSKTREAHASSTTPTIPTPSPTWATIFAAFMRGLYERPFVTETMPIGPPGRQGF